MELHAGLRQMFAGSEDPNMSAASFLVSCDHLDDTGDPDTPQTRARIAQLASLSDADFNQEHERVLQARKPSEKPE